MHRDPLTQAGLFFILRGFPWVKRAAEKEAGRTQDDFIA